MHPDLTPSQRTAILKAVTAELETVYNKPDTVIVSKELDTENITNMVNAFPFEASNDPKEVMLHVVEGLKKHAVHAPHPSYFGLFNPRPNFPSVMADVINSYLNPQLAAWSHSPYAVEIEHLVIKEFGLKFGYAKDSIDGTFCTGGAESNLTAVLSALNRHYPAMAEVGLLGLNKKPTIYCSTESHHSIEKAAKVAGLGRASVKSVPVDSDLRMNIEALRDQIEADRKNGCHPLMVVGTAGTTGAGSIDDLEKISKISEAYGLWFHVDAAYGGAAILTELKPFFKGIEKSDSITLDLHKWFSVPMATSLFLTNDTTILHKTFAVKTDYMPADGDQVHQIDAYIHSIQWSRRFIGLKIYLPLAVFGWDGYAKIISHQTEMGNQLRNLLQKDGWLIKNETALPIICFTHPDFQENNELISALVDDLVYSGETWLSAYPIDGILTVRACITNYATQVEDLEKLTRVLSRYKAKYSAGIARYWTGTKKSISH